MKSPEPPVLRCSHCNKPFDKASSLKRHGYYCLSTKVGRKPRLRSCIACAAAKARCSHDRPDCRRCVAKATRCQYPDETPTGAATPKRAEHQWGSTTTGDGATEATGILTPSMSSVMQQDAFDFSDAASHGAGGFSDSVSNAIWDDMFIPGDGPPTSMQQSSLGGKGFDSALSAFLHEDAGSPILFAASGLPRFQMNLSPPDSISIPRTPSYAMRSLVSRPRHMAKTKRVASLIFHTFKSYLVMMLRHKTLPPFIHPHFQKLGVPETQLEPVLNCINLMRMIGGGMPGCRKLFWTNVRLECQRLSTQVSEGPRHVPQSE